MEADNIQNQPNLIMQGGYVRYATVDYSSDVTTQPEKTENSVVGAETDDKPKASEATPSDVAEQSEAAPLDGAVQLPETDPMALKVQELQNNFSYDGFQMVRREAFAHQRDPAVTIRRDSVTFNTACISGLEDAVHVHLMINTEKKMMAVRACDENAKDALRWCIAKPDKRKSRKITSKIFSTMVYSLMEWADNCRYKILGYKIEHDGQYIYVFDLNETEIFNERPKRKGKGAADAPDVTDAAVTAPITDGSAGESPGTENPSDEQPPTENSAEGKSETAAIDTRTPHYPEAWRDTFGLSVEEHKKSLDIGVVEGFNVFENG